MSTLDVAVKLQLGNRRFEFELRSQARRIGIVGPSGSGKSTLLRVLAGLERRAVGRVSCRLEGWQDEAKFVPAWMRGIGWVPQDFGLFPHLDVARNLAFGGSRDASAIAEALGIADLATRRPTALSGGEKQRVAIGRALIAAKTLVLLDEPFACLDRETRDRVSQFVDGWCADHDLGLVLVTHQDSAVSNLVDEAWRVDVGGARSALVAIS